MPTEYRIERRAKALGQRMKTRLALVREAIAPEGKRPPFSKQLSKADALAFWKEHRHDAIGEAVLAKMTPEAVIELDGALAQHAAYERAMELNA